MRTNDTAALKRLYWELPIRSFTAPAERPVKETATVLPTYDSYKLIDQASSFGVEEITFCGPADARHSDLLQLTDYATRRRIGTTWSPNDPRIIESDVLERLKDAGLGTVAVLLDGSTAHEHERASGLPAASYDAAIAAIAAARKSRLRVQMNTGFTRRNIGDFWRLATLATDLNIDVWNIAIDYDPAGDTASQFNAVEVEKLFDQIFEATLHAPFAVQTSDARHFARYFRQRLLNEKRGGADTSTLSSAFQPFESEAAKERASLFVNPDGSVWPEAHIEISLGNVRFYPLQRLVVSSPLLRRLRSSSELNGKCFFCEFREVCGGSRGRAYLATGDPLAGDPLCCYHPARLKAAEGEEAKAQPSATP